MRWQFPLLTRADLLLLPTIQSPKSSPHRLISKSIKIVINVIRNRVGKANRKVKKMKALKSEGLLLIGWLINWLVGWLDGWLTIPP